MNITLTRKCSVCPQTFKTKSERRKTCSHECSVLHNRNHVKEYNQTEKCRELKRICTRRYTQSEKGRETRRIYMKSEKYKETVRKYQRSEKYKNYQKQYWRKNAASM